ncbi:MAG: hypothetical protein ITG01_13315 [Comamonas sp.]|nr:hypothetical protein [Comamonas sp.]
MANQWFRLYSEFAHDPKVQMMSEAMQRRYIMLMCMRCNGDVTLHDDEVAFHLRISAEDWAQTKALFISKGFIDENLNLLNWEKRQFKTDSTSSSAERVAKHRAKKRQGGNTDVTDAVTLHVTPDNALDTDTDTEQNRNKEPNGSVGTADLPGDKKNSEEGAKPGLPICPVQKVVDLYHEVLPELPKAKLLNDGRRKAIGKTWKWVLSTAKTDGQPRATNAAEALEWLKQYFTIARGNDFLMGRTTRTGEHANWQCDLDFLLTDRGMKHVIEKTQKVAA